MTTSATGLAACLHYSTPPSLRPEPAYTISEPVPCAGLQEDCRYSLITITYRNDRNILSELDYRLHNEWEYGIDYRAAFADSAPHWIGTEMTIESFSDYPPAVIAELRALWERRETVAPTGIDDVPLPDAVALALTEPDEPPVDAWGEAIPTWLLEPVADAPVPDVEPDPCAVLRTALSGLLTALQDEDRLNEFVQHANLFANDPCAPLFATLFERELKAAHTALSQ